jgi:hypothetical protein
MNNEQENLEKNILAKIESQKLSMKPKWYFFIISTLYIVGTILALLGTMFIFSLIIFSLHLSGAWFVPGFGFYGFAVFLQTIPWLMALLGIIFLFILQILIRHFAYAYSKPLVYSAGVIIIGGLLGSVLIAQTDFHKNLFVKTQRMRGPVNQIIYEKFGNQRAKNISIGEVNKLTSSGFLLLTREGELLEIQVTPETVLSPEKIILNQDFVVVFGQRQDGSIVALGIKKITREPFMNMRMQRMK